MSILNPLTIHKQLAPRMTSSLSTRGLYTLSCSSAARRHVGLLRCSRWRLQQREVHRLAVAAAATRARMWWSWQRKHSAVGPRVGLVDLAAGVATRDKISVLKTSTTVAHQLVSSPACELCDPQMRRSAGEKLAGRTRQCCAAGPGNFRSAGGQRGERPASHALEC